MLARHREISRGRRYTGGMAPHPLPLAWSEINPYLVHHDDDPHRLAAEVFAIDDRYLRLLADRRAEDAPREDPDP